MFNVAKKVKVETNVPRPAFHLAQVTLYYLWPTPEALARPSQGPNPAASAHELHRFHPLRRWWAELIGGGGESSDGTRRPTEPPQGDSHRLP